jgi:hypothetical protein
MNILRKLWSAWKAFGHLMGNVVARVALSIFYFTVFVPFGLGVRWFSDPLQIKSKPNGLWRPRSTADATLAEVERQF